jgi:hypothetical protein
MLYIPDTKHMSPASTAQLYVVTETWTTWRLIETGDLLTDGQQKWRQAAITCGDVLL